MTIGPPDEPGSSGATCSMLPVIRRPRGPRKLRSTPVTKPNVTRSPRPPGFDRAKIGAPIPGVLSVAHSIADKIPGLDSNDSEVPVDVVSQDLTSCRVPIGKRDGDLVAAHVVRIGQYLTLAQHHAGSDAPALPDADDRVADLLGYRWISSWIPSSAPIFSLPPLLIVTCKLLLSRSVSITGRYGLSMSEQESAVRERAPSPLADALAQVGDRWTSARRAGPAPGPRRFNELLEEIPGIAANILSQRLKRLERDALLVSRPYTERPPRAAYELTAEGRELAGALRLLAQWGARHALPAEAPRHSACGTPLEARWYCPTCDHLVEDEPELEMQLL